MADVTTWKLVPVDCTDEIAEAIAAEAHVCGGGAETIWRKALAAAPESAPLSKAAIADAIRRVDEDFGYSIRLTRLVDNEAEYTLAYSGGEKLTFESNSDANEHTRQRRDELRAAAILALLGAS